MDVRRYYRQESAGKVDRVIARLQSPTGARQIGAFVICIGFGVLLLRPIRDADTFWHLSLGKAVVQFHARSFPDPISLEAYRQPCVAAEWLWDVITYGVFSTFGYAGLSVFLALLVAMTCFAVFRLAAVHSGDSLPAY